VDAVVVDPPYGGNVMYAELSDFFYVWLKRSVGDIYPDWFDTELVDKDSEAVANPARFTGAQGGKPKELATRDYLLKMRRVFREMRRVVKPNGSMTVMFTHRETDMWNALGLALLETGWEIGSSWPVHTESEHSLHIAQKNAARSTVLLFCRPRQTAETQSFWDQDLRNEVTRTAGERAREFQEAGIDGVDLYLSTFGPVLGVLSRHWPIISEDVDRETGESLPLEPEAALTIARREVFRLQREGLLDGRAANWDAATDWYLLAWKSFGAREFSYDEARKMAMAQGAEGDELRTRHRLLSQKSGTAALLQPGQRQSRDHVNPDAATFTRAVDALHTAMWLYDTEGERRCRQFLQGTGLIADSDFQTLFQAALNAIPRTRKYTRGQITGFNVPEAETLENMRLSLFPDIEFTEKLDTNTGAEQAALDIG
jgi:adenine-specific DNA methylase